jgi:hypothetical protein
MINDVIQTLLAEISKVSPVVSETLNQVNTTAHNAYFTGPRDVPIFIGAVTYTAAVAVACIWHGWYTGKQAKTQ